MNWIRIEAQGQLQEVDAISEKHYAIIYKHSTRCGISSASLRRLEEEYQTSPDTGIVHYFLDILKFREISSAIAERYGVKHESPQILLIRNGQCVYHRSHQAISYDSVRKQIQVRG